MTQERDKNEIEISSQNSSRKVEEHTKRFTGSSQNNIELIFSRLISQYGVKIFEGDEKRIDGSKAEWRHAFNAVPLEVLNNAVSEHISKRQYFPTISEIFAILINIQSPQAAWHVRETDLLAKQAWLGVDSWIRKTRSERDCRELFYGKYECEINEAHKDHAYAFRNFTAWGKDYAE